MLLGDGKHGIGFTTLGSKFTTSGKSGLQNAKKMMEKSSPLSFTKSTPWSSHPPLAVAPSLVAVAGPVRWFHQRHGSFWRDRKGSRPVVSAFEDWQHIGVFMYFSARINFTWVKTYGKLPRKLHHQRAYNPQKLSLRTPSHHGLWQAMYWIVQSPTICEGFSIHSYLSPSYPSMNGQKSLKVVIVVIRWKLRHLGGGGCGGCGSCSTCCLMTNTSAGATPHSEIDASIHVEPPSRKQRKKDLGDLDDLGDTYQTSGWCRVIQLYNLPFHPWNCLCAWCRRSTKVPFPSQNTIFLVCKINLYHPILFGQCFNRYIHRLCLLVGRLALWNQVKSLTMWCHDLALPLLGDCLSLWFGSSDSLMNWLWGWCNGCAHLLLGFFCILTRTPVTPEIGGKSKGC